MMIDQDVLDLHCRVSYSSATGMTRLTMCSPYKFSVVILPFQEEETYLIEMLFWILVSLVKLDIDSDELHVGPCHASSSALHTACLPLPHPSGPCHVKLPVTHPGSLTSTLETSSTSAPLPPFPSPYPVSSCSSRSAACL